MRRIFLILLLAITQMGAAPAPVVAPREDAVRIPLVALLANPERFDGKLVTIEGFLNLEYEGDAIYQSRSDFDEMLTGNAIWVDGPKFEEPSARRDLSGRHVSLTGRFDADMRGHFSAYAGGLAATGIHIQLSRDQIGATMTPPYREGPWPLIILILLVSSVLLALALAVRRRRTAASPGAILTATALLVASAIGVFSILRLWELPVLIHGFIKLGPAWAAPPLLAELVVGALALCASVFFAVRRNMFLCVVFSAAQLIAPAVNEARAFALFDVPLSIYPARDSNYRWERKGPLPPEGRTAGPDWLGLPR
jgi:hypothetical protein